MWYCHLVGMSVAPKPSSFLVPSNFAWLGHPMMRGCTWQAFLNSLLVCVLVSSSGLEVLRTEAHKKEPWQISVECWCCMRATREMSRPGMSNGLLCYLSVYLFDVKLGYLDPDKKDKRWCSWPNINCTNLYLYFSCFTCITYFSLILYLRVQS